ncbi:hypothetical protein [Pelagibius sp.]|uniref:hypothetical protein n=1 Tax=Pelagibius sp. TaxID=1931238 RepID=UPI0026174B4D|nr:hypothetical protein [Pelagibius sp.]
MLRAEKVFQTRLALPICVAFATVLGAALSGSATAEDKQRAVTLDVVIAEGAEPLREAVVFSIARIGPGGRLEPPAEEVGAPLKTTLADGRYQVEARYGDASALSVFDVSGRAVTHRVNLNAGWAQLRVIPHRGAQPLASAIDWQILTYGRDASGQRRPVAAVRSPNPQVVLPQGHYLVVARTADALARHTIEITAGHTYKYTLDLNAGAVAFSALRGRGGPVINETVDWKVFKANDTSFSEPVATRSAANGQFLLRQGRYVVLASRGQWKGRATVEVRPGNERRIAVELK